MADENPKDVESPPVELPQETGADISAPAPTKDPLEHAFTIDNRVVVKRLLAAGLDAVGKTVVVGGWVKTGRKQGKDTFVFLEVNDGSSHASVQVMVHTDVYDIKKLASTGTSVLIRGDVKACDGNAKQVIEVVATEVLFVGECDPKGYPIAKSAIPLEKLREIIRFRSRTSLIQSVFRVRNALAHATHLFFQENGFKYLHAPIITSHDCEGAGEMFQVTTMLQDAEKIRSSPPTDESIQAADAKVAELEETIATMKAAKKDKRKIKKETEKLGPIKSEAEQLKKQLATAVPHGGLYTTDKGKIDYGEDFFKRAAHLTVSGQLDAEIYACSMTSIYTFGPTFRAEDSHTTRHLAEFWMIEPEIAFCDLEGDMKCAEQYVQFCAKYVLDNCLDDMEFLAAKVDKDCIERAKNVVAKGFGRISYTEAVELLIQHVAEKKVKFGERVVWGIDLGSEHERYLAEQVFKGPVIVYNYPKDIKAFYMRMNEDGKTVAAMDVLVPKVGELIGGSQREERTENLIKRIEEMNLDQADYEWYLDLRRFGTVPHAGFGLGFERLVLFTTGIENIRDVIPFPRYPGKIL